MFERFTDRARRVVTLAQDEARRLDHNYIGTEHLLLGLLAEGEGVAAQALKAVDVSLEAVRQQVEDIIGRGGSAPTGTIPFTPRAKKVLELSLREAMNSGHNHLGTEHILLGLVREGEGVAAQILVRLGADLSRVRSTVLDLLGAPEPTGRPSSFRPRPRSAPEVIDYPSKPPAAPRCPACRSDLSGNLRRTLVEVPEGPSVEAIWCSICGTTLGVLPPAQG